MPSLKQHQSGQFTKMLILGDSGTGKTGGLVSLVKEGYKLRILDYDNGLDSLKMQIQHRCPDKLENVEFRTLKDKVKAAGNGAILDGPPRALVDGLKMLDHWKYTYDGVETDLGKPATWGPECILVIDSLTFMGKAALNFVRIVQPQKDGRMEYFHAQGHIRAMLDIIQAEAFQTNVIVITHIDYQERQDGMTKGYPNAIGSALGPDIPQYFNSVASVTTTGAGDKLKRTIQTVSTAMLDLKNPAPFAMAPSLPLETGLADFFRTVRA